MRLQLSFATRRMLAMRFEPYIKTNQPERTMNDTPTPRTDADERMAWDSEYMVPPETARELERELTAVTEQRDAVTLRLGKTQERMIDAERQRDRLAEALRSIKNELGVPQPEYPAPVANAVKIANQALQALTPTP